MAQWIYTAPFPEIGLDSVPFEAFDALLIAEEKAVDAEFELFESAIRKAGLESSHGEYILRYLEINSYSVNHPARKSLDCRYDEESRSLCHCKRLHDRQTHEEII